MFRTICTVILAFFLVTAPVAADDFGFLSFIEKRAHEDMRLFHETLGTLFRLPIEHIRDLAATVPKPSDLFMILRIGQLSGRPLDHVLGAYRSGQGKGWGVIAKEMGIKPGSRAFHELKQSDQFYAHKQSNQSKGKNKRKGKRKGKK